MPEIFPDLSNARVSFERLMSDECVITRDSEGVFDDTLDEVTGELAEDASNDVTVYSGKCMMRPDRPERGESGGSVVTLRSYKLRLPASAPVIQPDDLVTITKSARDPQLAGTKLVAKSIEKSTLLVARTVWLEEVDRGPDTVRE